MAKSGLCFMILGHVIFQFPIFMPLSLQERQEAEEDFGKFASFSAVAHAFDDYPLRPVSIISCQDAGKSAELLRVKAFTHLEFC